MLVEEDPEVGRVLQAEPSGNKFCDWLSNISAIITLVGMFIAPFYFYKVAKIYFKHHEDPDVKNTYKSLFEGLQIDSFPQLNYALVFILRRYTMVLALTLLPSQRNIQINL